IARATALATAPRATGAAARSAAAIPAPGAGISDPGAGDAPALVEAPPRRRIGAALGIAAALAVAGAGVAVWRYRQPVESPLAAADAKLACPMLDASGVQGSAGWLGA